MDDVRIRPQAVTVACIDSKPWSRRRKEHVRDGVGDAGFGDIAAVIAGFVGSLVSIGRCAKAAEPASATIDLTRAVIVVPSDASAREKKAVAMLVDEVEKRSQIRWQVAAESPKTDGAAFVVVGRETNLTRDYPQTKPWLARQPATAGAEGYRIQMPEKATVLVVGNDERGVLFGVGRLLRELRMSRGKILLPAGFHRIMPPHTAARASARVSAEDEFVRRVGPPGMGAILSRHGGLRDECHRIDSAALG